MSADGHDTALEQSLGWSSFGRLSVSAHPMADEDGSGWGEMIKGHVKWFDATKGFGFVVTESKRGDVLLHANVLRSFGRSSVVEGSQIVIEVEETEKGLQATMIHAIEAPQPEILPGREGEKQRPSDLALHAEAKSQLLPARVKWFDKIKGFGFVNTFGSGDDIFVHMEVLRMYGLSDLQPGEAVSVRIVDGPRGRMASEIRSWDYAMTESVRSIGL